MFFMTTAIYTEIVPNQDAIPDTIKHSEGKPFFAEKMQDLTANY